MNKLVEEIIKPILEADSKITKVVGIFGGRFQPFGPHHKKVYQWLSKQFDDAYITTSNIKQLPRHPMNFKEKVRHMSKMGIPSSKIIMEKSPFVAKNLAKKFNPKTTAFVYIFGKKDTGRLGGGKYFQDFKKNKNNLKGHEEHGYYLVAPHMSVSAGGLEVSGTAMRELLGSKKYKENREKLFKKMFGYFNQGIFNMMTNKFSKIFEVNEGLPTKIKQFKKTKKVKHEPDSAKGTHNSTDTFSKHHADSTGAGEMGNIAEPDTYDWDDSGDEPNPGGHQVKKDKKKKGWEPVEESDIEIVPWDNTRPKPVDPKLFDKKKQDLLFDTKDWLKKGSKKDRVIKLKLMKLYTKAFKQMPGSPNQEKIKKEIEKLRNQLSEGVDLPIKVGDVVKMGRFKNKKVTIKSIDFNEKGDLLINGRPALKFRVIKKDVDEDVNVVKKKGKDSGNYRDYDSPKDSDFKEPYKHIEEFLTTIDMNKIIKEVSTAKESGLQAVDSGPNMFMGGMEGYSGRNTTSAEKLGWEVINYILNVDVNNVPPFDSDLLSMGWPMGPHKSVSYLPAGIGTGKTPNNQENLTGRAGYNKWLRNIKPVAREVGMELLKFTKKDKDIVKQMAKDTKDTIKQQEKEEVKESFTKDWWKKELIENIVTKTQLKPREKELLLMGGAYGHMAHPFDDKDLTFGDLKKIITLGLGGQLNREDNVTEKLDGQNIMVSWKDGKLIAARNKGHLKNSGATALDAKGIASKFKGRGAIRNAFVYAMRDLEKAISSLSEKQKVKIFDNGSSWMNMEIMYPSSANVIDYDVAHLVFHGALKYDKNGTPIGEAKGSGRMLAGMIQQVNQHIQKKYSIGKPIFLTIPKHQDFGKMKNKFLSSLMRYQKRFGLSDNDTLGLYHQKWWEQYITKQSKGKVTPKVLKGLVKRWAFFDKSYKIPQIKKDIKDKKFLEWVLSFDKNNHSRQVKENMKPFEILFFQVGAEIMKNMSGFMAANPKKSIQGIRKRLNTAIANVRKGGDLKKLNTLKLQLDKLNAIGGVDAIVPSEGIVFKYKGKTYKFTGAFAPINQITGLISF